MTRVALDVRALEHPELAERGIGRYVASLSEALREQPVDVVELRRLARPHAPERVRELWEHALLARDVRAAHADVLHSPTIDYASVRPGVPHVVTVHDLAPLEHPERYLRTGVKHRLRYASVKRAARVITPSMTVAGNCARMLDVDPGRIAVVREAPAPVFRPHPDPDAVLAHLDLPDRYLLWVGGLDPPDPRKGVERLAHTVVTHGGLPLVLAGRADSTAAALAGRGHVQLVGRLEDDELAALYTCADALVFPSEDEGFGLPPVEALACGTPVVAFAATALIETLAAEPGATLVEPGDYNALLEAAERVAGTRAPIPTRTWSDVAVETIAVYEEARGNAST